MEKTLQEYIDQKFNEVIWRMNQVAAIDKTTEIVFRICFQQGFIDGQEYIIEKWQKTLKNATP